MGLRAFLRGDDIQLGIDSAEDRALTQDQVPIEVWQAWAPRGRPLTTVSRQNAMAVATAWSCVKLLADGIGTIPLRVYRQLPDGSRIPAGPDQRLAQLLARPWQGATAIDLVSMMVTHLCLFGEAWMPKFTQEGSIVALGPLLHPDRMQIFIRGNNVSYALDGRESYGPPEIVFVRGLLDSIGLRGMSPVSQAQSAFELNEALRESSHQFFKEGSRPSGVLTVGEGASEAAIKSLREDWRNLYSAAGGIQNMHRVAVLRGEMNFTPITFSLADQEFLASREFSVREIAAIFGLPAWAVNGDSGSSLTYANTTQQAQFLIQHSFRPITSRIEAALSADPTLCPGNTFCAFDFSELLRGSPAERSDFYVKALGNDKQPGWMTRQEVRAAENLPPEPAPAVPTPGGAQP